MSTPEISLRSQIDLLGTQPECAFLAGVLLEQTGPRSVGDIRRLAREQMEDMNSRLDPPIYEDPSNRILNRGLRRLKRAGIANYQGRRWSISEEGRIRVSLAFSVIHGMFS